VLQATPVGGRMLMAIDAEAALGHNLVVFLPRDAMHKRGLCRHAVSVCVCVCVSVCHVRELCRNE